MSHWAESYVGRPYKFGEADCACLIEDVLKDQFNTELKLPQLRVAGLRNQSKMIEDMQGDYAVLTSTPREGDGVLMYSRGRISHMGVYCIINNEPYVLHAMRNAGQVTLHKISVLQKIGLELEGYYTWI